MTIDEAIYDLNNCIGTNLIKVESRKQLAEWLKELKDMREFKQQVENIVNNRGYNQCTDEDTCLCDGNCNACKYVKIVNLLNVIEVGGKMIRKDWNFWKSFCFRRWIMYKDI